MSKKFKINKSDKRIGNFVYHPENDAVKLSDISGLITHRVSTLIPKGQFIAGAIENDYDKWLEAYAVVMFNVLSCVPDEQFLNELNNAAVNCVERHPQLYGLKKDIDKAEDDAILKDQKEYHEAIESLKDGDTD